MTALFCHIFLFSLLAYANCKDAKARQDAVNSDLVLTNVERKVDISTHLAKISSSITIENTGKSSVGFLLYAVEPSLQENLSFLGASVSYVLSTCSDSHLLSYLQKITGPVGYLAWRSAI